VPELDRGSSSSLRRTAGMHPLRSPADVRELRVVVRPAERHAGPPVAIALAELPSRRASSATTSMVTPTGRGTRRRRRRPPDLLLRHRPVRLAQRRQSFSSLSRSSPRISASTGRSPTMTASPWTSRLGRCRGSRSARSWPRPRLDLFRPSADRGSGAHAESGRALVVRV